MEEDNVYNYSTVVYKAIQQPNVVLGIGLMPALIILIFTIILINLISIWCFLVGLILFVITRKICSSDNHMLTFLFDKILQPPVYLA